MQRRTQTSRLLLFNLHSILAVRTEALHCILPSLSSPCIHLLPANTDGPRSHTSHMQPTCQRRTRAALQTFKNFPHMPVLLTNRSIKLGVNLCYYRNSLNLEMIAYKFMFCENCLIFKRIFSENTRNTLEFCKGV